MLLISCQGKDSEIDETIKDGEEVEIITEEPELFSDQEVLENFFINNYYSFNTSDDSENYLSIFENEFDSL